MNKRDVISLSYEIKTMTAKMGIVSSLVVLIASISIVINYAWADDHTSVPSWTKELSDLWSQGNISDVEAVNAFQYLVDNKIINVYDLSYNHNVSFDKKVQQTRILSSFLWNEYNKPTDFKLVNNVFHNPGVHYMSVQPAPTWAPYTNNLVLNATNYWKDKIGAKFLYSSGPYKEASITVRWLKEPDSQYAGYTVGGMMEVALGDSRCDGMWHAYNTDFVTATLTHELGHALGFGHSTNMSDIMYPIISGKKYAPIEQTLVIGLNKSVFVHVCTFSHTSTFHYIIKSDDENKPLTIYFVSSKMEYDKFVNGEKFYHYIGDGCFGTASIFYDDTCYNVSNYGGLLISASNNLQSTQNVTLTLEEK